MKWEKVESLSHHIGVIPAMNCAADMIARTASSVFSGQDFPIPVLDSKRKNQTRFQKREFENERVFNKRVTTRKTIFTR